jgi:hypothetical protein
VTRDRRETNRRGGIQEGMSAPTHLPFWKDMAHKIGAPMFAGTIVGCTLAGKIEPAHWVLLAIGTALIFFSHRHAYHA